MDEDWLELIADYNAAYEFERGREAARADRVQKVIIMVPKKRK
ncbi:hypothetical protein [Ancylobacter polymorphus]|uniref:Uncharacterized protein n=1 Tax=Ancylobacter polymorphus TaxID=223390 RepID=A0ABU0B698_9HYPH|nr:hypothetical protein [Ancylobacter polymorphus]MDQ0301348.1 hypothetical protein [Ancylobacter polymorphus]